jgi:hypothetical protein
LIRRILKAIGWIVGPILGLGIAAYLVAVAINWRDRAPSEAAIRLANAYRERPMIADEDNAFIYAMGFGVAPEENPFTMGLKRVAWMERSGASASAKGDPLGESPDYRQTRHAAIKDFIEACQPGSSRCNDAFLAGDAVFERWSASEGWLLARYRALITHVGWREVPFRLDTPLPPYGLIIDGQRLLLLNAKKVAQTGDHAAVRNLLEQDVRFWRAVLESSDTLISKMIATVALYRHFELGNLVLREFADENAMRAMPNEWPPRIASRNFVTGCVINGVTRPGLIAAAEAEGIRSGLRSSFDVFNARETPGAERREELRVRKR